MSLPSEMPQKNKIYDWRNMDFLLEFHVEEKTVLSNNP